LRAPLRYAAPPPLGDPGASPLGAQISFVGETLSARRVRARNGRDFADFRVATLDGVVVRVRCFNRGWLAERHPRGATALFSGRVESGPPAIVVSGSAVAALTTPADAESALRKLEPIHPKIEGVAEGTLRLVLREALAAIASVPDPLPAVDREALGLPPLAEALRLVHEPATAADAERGGARLLFDRILALALAARGAFVSAPAPVLRAVPLVRERIAARLPFALTPGQSAALEEILADLARPVAMRRLLLGDVGSGKTAVAVGALLATIAAGAQGLFVAPTDVLAAQHARTLTRWLAGSRVRLGLLTARTPRPERAALLDAAAEGALDLLIGTHAALADDVRLPRLGLAVVDEQHRFGVLQRLRARDKAERPHLLALSATPIPRSLALALFGDLACTRLAGRPSGRPPPTAVVSEAAPAFAALREAVRRGERAFVVYPTVAGEAAPAVEREGRKLVKPGGPLHGLAVAFLHGAQKAPERDAAFAAFRDGAAVVLVCTSIVEVGVDVPEASTMVVVGADRFGLASLHQLRGRVGRGAAPGVVHLVPGGGPAAPSPKAAAEAARRLGLLASETDGFRLAEADLYLRGPGDFCGVRQHGHGGALPLAEGRDRGFPEAAAAVAARLAADGYDPARDPYYPRLSSALGGVRFEPPDAL
jgi:ATP-dependent DNA helicase RecG